MSGLRDPRLPDGTPNFSAPTPKTPDGKPDLSGIWKPSPALHRQHRFGPEARRCSLPALGRGVVQAAARNREQRRSRPGNCIPGGVPRSDAVPYPFKIVNSEKMVIILYEAVHSYRQIFTDGRELPKDPNPTWLGYSIGHWEGDDFVAETAGFNNQGWLDNDGRPATDALHVTERFRRKDFGHMDILITIDDPKAYTKPWNVTLPLKLMPDTDLLEYVCNENNKDLHHLVGK